MTFFNKKINRIIFKYEFNIKDFGVLKMNLNEGLTKIIKEYPNIREYANIKNKEEKGLFNPKMETKKNEYSKFLSKFKKSIKEIVLNNTNLDYNIKYSNLAQGADVVPYITITNPNTPSINENYYIVYLFKPNGKGVYLSLCLGVNQFKEYKKAHFNNEDLTKIKRIVNTFRNHVKAINENDDKSNLDFSKYSETCDLESNYHLAKAYSAGSIYCKYYELDEDKNILLPTESELENDLNEFISLYQYFSNYNDYFNQIKDNELINEEYDEKETSSKGYNSFYEYLLDEGYYFDAETIENYLLSLKVKPFVILTGNSGTGKTKLSKLFAKYLNDKNNCKIIPVGANWTENRHILGYFNIIKSKPQYTPAYYLIKDAQDKSYPHFLILDEMNLSHVERYFADFLSAIESKEPIPLQEKEELELTNNLFIIGTVNVDETTYMFSPKVLDRANTIEFKTCSAKDYMTNKLNKTIPKGNIEYLEDILKDNDIREMSIEELEKIFNNEIFWDELANEIYKFQDILKDAGFDFGFRTINEITRFMAVAYRYEGEPENWNNWKRYFDAQIKQKMLPKLHGSQKVIGETLDELREACEDYPNSKAKIIEMQNVLNKQRYVSFIN